MWAWLDRCERSDGASCVVCDSAVGAVGAVTHRTGLTMGFLLKIKDRTALVKIFTNSAKLYARMTFPSY
jgi:hypothetical protein